MRFYQNLFLFSSEGNTRLVPPNTNLSLSHAIHLKDTSGESELSMNR